MPGERVEPQRTLVTAPVFARAVIDAWWAVATDPLLAPSKGAVGILYAHYMIETGGLNCYGWNIGNVKYVPGCGYDYHCLRGVWEGETPANAQALIARGEAVIDPNQSHQKSCAPNISVVFNPPHPQTRFVTFPDLAESMDDHLLLLCKKRYANAWPALLSGNVMSFARALKERGYMTSTAEAYGNGMTPSFKHFMASQEFDAALRASKEDVTEPVYEFSGGILHSGVEFEPIVYNFDSED